MSNVRRQPPETTRTAIAACRAGLFCAYSAGGSQSIWHKPMVSILVGLVGAEINDRRGG